MAPGKNSSFTKEEAQQFLKRIGVFKNFRYITGDEREQVMTMLELVPSTHSNNQRFCCETWKIGNVIYNHYTGSGMDDLEEVTEYE